MARPRRRRGNTLSLFPFLSVLACIIGTLTLLITATAIGQIGGGAIDLERYEALEAEIASGRRELAELRALAQEVEGLGDALAAARAERERLAAQREALGEALAAGAPLREQLETSEERVARLEAELAEVRADRDGLEQELRERREALARAPILIEPSGSGVGLEPHFVECREDGLILYEGPERRPIRVPAARIATSLDVRGFLRRVRLRGGATAVLLVRPDGIGSCYALEREVAQHRVRHGKVPLPADGELDFSAVPKAGG